MTAPLVVLQHNWEANVVRKLSWKTDIIPLRNGAEQRRRLRAEPREELTYSITTSSQEESAKLAKLLWSTRDMRIAFPRWEDAMMLAIPAVATDTTLVVDAEIGPRQFGMDAVLYHEEVGVERVTIDFFAADTITLLDPVENDWPAGVMVIPVITGYVAPQVGGDDSSNHLSTLVVTIEVEEDIAGVTTGGAAQAMVPATIDVYPHAIGSEGTISFGDVQGIVIEVKDASGTLIPDADVVVTPFPGPTLVNVYPTGMPNIWNVRNLRVDESLGSTPQDVSLVIESGAISETYDVRVQ